MAPGPCGAHSSLADPHSRSAAWVPSTSAVQRTSLAEHSYPSCCAGLKSPCTTFSRPLDLPEGQVQEHWSAPLRARCRSTSPGLYALVPPDRAHGRSLRDFPIAGILAVTVISIVLIIVVTAEASRTRRPYVAPSTGLSANCAKAGIVSAVYPMTYRRCAAGSDNKFYECFLQDLRATVDKPRCRAAKGASSA